ncbi:MAG: thioredoxin family protein, partial [Bacteroidales bacterium]|nr:thioredoxin family protein [Bacteroidales bacterium]
TIVVASAGGQIIKPIIGMLGFSLAFALPFTLFALFPGWLQKLPKSGGWLNSVKVFLGFIELAFALKFLNIPDQTYQWGILDREVYLSMWIVIFVLLGMYLLGKIRFPLDSESTHIKSFPRLLIAIASFSFAVYMVPGLWGAPLKALAGWLPPMGTQDFDINAIARNNAGGGGGNTTYELCDVPKYSEKFKPLPHGLKGYYELEQAYECSKEQKKPIFIDFTGHGCTNCREMESNVWSDPRVLEILRNEFIIVALYVDDKAVELPEEEWYTNKRGRLIKSLGTKNADIMISQFNTNAQPYYVIVDENGTILTSPHAYDLDIQNFINFMEDGLKNYKKSKENS